MPYTTEQMNEKEMEDRTYDSVCLECFSNFVVCWGGAFGYNSMLLRCSKDAKHHGIARLAEEKEYSYQTRRKFMAQDHGKETAIALRRFDAVVTLTRQSATDILKIMWPNAQEASPAEFAKALGLCVDYGLDPRLNELFMIPFKKKDKDGNVIGTTYETVRGIRATRKVALRKHKYSYVDFTPRLMTEDEEKKVYKTADPDKIRYITKLKDLESGAEAPGYGEWSKYKTSGGKKYHNNPKGLDKGNSMENMSAIHSERAALERLFPADMPPSRIPVVDEAFVDAEYHVVDSEESSGENEEPIEQPGGGEPPTIISKPEGDEKAGAMAGDKQGGGEGKHESTTFSSQKGEGKTKTAASAPAAEPAIEGEGFHIALTWLDQTLKLIKWSEPTAKTWIASNLKADTQGGLTEVLARLSRAQAEEFVHELEERSAKVQPELFD